MSISWTEGARALRAWRRQRFSWGLWVPVATTLTLASTIEAPTTPGLLGLRLSAALLALGGLRLWDDLEDLPRDRVHHPERVLTQTPHVAMARAMVPAPILLAASLASTGQGRPAVILGVCLGLAVLYRWGWQSRELGQWLRLLKYPALVAALGIALDPMGALAMTLVYVGVCHDEAVDERQRPWRSMWAVLFGLCSMCWCAMWTEPALLRVALLMTHALLLATLAGSPCLQPPRSMLRAALLLLLMLHFVLPQLL